MLSYLQDHLNIVEIYICLTIIWISINYVGKKVNLYVLMIVLIGAVNEACMLYFGYCKVSTGFNTTVYAILHNILWLLIFFRISPQKKSGPVIVAYTIICLINLFFFEGPQKFNLISFIVGAVIYLLFFVFEIIRNLRKENFSFFIKNEYLLICSPIIFFLGLSLILSFDFSILKTPVINTLTIFQLISYSSNLMYYSMINFYIYKEKKNSNVK